MLQAIRNMMNSGVNSMNDCRKNNKQEDVTSNVGKYQEDVFELLRKKRIEYNVKRVQLWMN